MSPESLIKVCFMGHFDLAYPRNKIIYEGLKSNGVKIRECNISFSIMEQKFWRRYISLYKAYNRLPGDHDAIFVPMVNQKNIPFAYLIARIFRKKLLFDPFISLYNTYVEDRGTAAPGSLLSLIYFLQDKISLRLSDRIIADTEQHKLYFHEKYKVRKDKISTVYVGTDETIFYPRDNPPDSKNFIVCFYGTYLPLHGIEYIIKAAEILKNQRDITFRLIGDGQTYNDIQNLARRFNLSNISFIPRVSIEELPVEISRSHICLGIFGNTQKAQRVIPNKIFQTLSMKKPIITGNTPAIREVFEDGRHLILCKTGDPHSLAEKILLLKENPEIRDSISQKGYELVSERFVTQKIGEEVKKIIVAMLKRKV